VLRLVAPAKINLGLRVAGRRPDGFHELESVFLPLDLADELELEVDETAGAGVHLELDPPRDDLPSGSENLVVRAALAFCAAAGLSCELRVRLAKRVPAAAGLGGGSSDAGAILRGLAQRFPGAVAPAELERMALALGADVPFFLSPGPARVSGVGERREPLVGSLPRFWLLLANPGRPLETAAVFRAYAASRPPSAGPLGPDLAAALARPQAPALRQLVRNDLEPAATQLCPELASLRLALEAAGAGVVGLSGSGATLYGVFESLEAVTAARERFLSGVESGIWLRVARTGESG